MNNPRYFVTKSSRNSPYGGPSWRTDAPRWFNSYEEARIWATKLTHRNPVGFEVASIPSGYIAGDYPLMVRDPAIITELEEQVAMLEALLDIYPRKKANKLLEDSAKVIGLLEDQVEIITMYRKRAELDRIKLFKMLKNLEWSGQRRAPARDFSRNTHYFCCPECNAFRNTHEPGCKLQKLITEVETHIGAADD